MRIKKLQFLINNWYRNRKLNVVILAGILIMLTAVIFAINTGLNRKIPGPVPWTRQETTPTSSSETETYPDSDTDYETEGTFNDDDSEPVSSFTPEESTHTPDDSTLSPVITTPIPTTPPYNLTPRGDAAKAEVKVVSGSPRLFINGDMVTGNMFFGNTDMKSLYSIITDQVRHVANNGINRYSMIYNLDFSNNINLELKYQSLRNDLDSILDGDKAAKIIVRVNVGNFRGINAQPNEIMQYVDGTKVNLVSIASDRWYEDAMTRLKELISYIRNHPDYAPHVIGYHLESGEWFQYLYREHGLDISPANDAKFREWVTQKYKNNTTLKTAWGDTYTLSNIQVPRDLPDNKSATGYKTDLLLKADEQRYIDYFDYINDLVSDRIAGLATAVKQASNRENIVIAFYGYYFDLFDAQSGHFNLRKLLNYKDIDGFASPVTYNDRINSSLGASSGYMSPVDSITRAGKLWFSESDQRTFINRPGMPNDTFLTAIPNLEGIYEVHKREIGDCIVHGSSMYPMDLMGLGWLDDPTIWNNFGKLDKLNLSYAKAQKSKPVFDVALVVDEKAESIVGAPWNLSRSLLNQMRLNMYRAGVSFALVELEDVLAGRVDDAKVYIFVNPYRMSASTLAAISKRIQRDNKTLVFMYGFGNAGIEDIRKLTGMNIGMEYSRKSTRMTAVSQNDMPGFGYNHNSDHVYPRYRVTGGQSTVLGRYLDESIGFALYKGNNYNTFFYGGVVMDTDTIRSIVNYAGANIFIETDDILTANDNFISLHTASAGVKKINFNKSVDVYDYFADRWYINVESVTLGLPAGTTSYLFYGRKSDIEAMDLYKWSK